MVVTQRRQSKIVPIAGGKGGVGKTELCAGLGIRLGQLGYRTVLVDLDLGGSNLHSALSIKNKNPGLGNLFSDRRLTFAGLVAHTPYDNLSFVPGDVLVAGIPNITFSQKQSLIRHIEALEADYVLLDLGSGAANNVVDFFLISNSGVVVSSPHVGSVLNAYSFLKNTVFRFLFRAFAKQPEVARHLRREIQEKRPGQPVQIGKVIERMVTVDREAAQKARRYIDVLQPSLVLNFVRGSEDLNIAESLRELVHKNLDVSLQSLGAVMFDERLATSRRATQPVVVTDPSSVLAVQIDRVAQKIVQSPEFPTLALERDMYEDSYELTRIELQYDEAEIQTVQAETVAPSHGDAEEFIQVMAAQRKTIQELQGTVRMLTMRGQR